jgi:hypothetical protein
MIRLRSTLNAAKAIKQMAFGNLHDGRYKGHGRDPIAFISLLRKERFHHEERYEGTGALVIALCWFDGVDGDDSRERYDIVSNLGLSIEHRG